MLENKEIDYFLVGGYDSQEKLNRIRLIKLTFDIRNILLNIEY